MADEASLSSPRLADVLAAAAGAGHKRVLVTMVSCLNLARVVAGCAPVGGVAAKWWHGSQGRLGRGPIGLSGTL